MTAAAVMRFIARTYPRRHMEKCEVVVIGAGPAGLATAGALRHYGIGAVVLERDAIGASWRGHYDRLHLHTVRWLSHLPGYRLRYSHPITGMLREINREARRIGYAFARDRAARNGGAPLGKRARAMLAVRLGIPAAA